MAQRPPPRGQVLVVPPEIKSDINTYSGYLKPSSIYADRPLKGLFLAPVNIKYIGDQIYSLITNATYVSRNLPDESNDYLDTGAPNYRDQLRSHGKHDSSVGFGNRAGGARARKIDTLIAGFKRNYGLLQDVVPDMVRDHVLPKPEDLPIANPVMQLSQTNLNFIQESATNFIMVPQSLIANADRISPDTGAVEAGESEYDASSWSDGSWHPEHLFTNKARNRHNNYWTPIEVNYESSPDGKGPGHRYTSNVYHNNRKGNRAVSGDGVVQNFQNEQFPRWQYSVNDRPIDRDYVEVSQAQNGVQDRRVQGTRGFDMSALVKRSTY